MALDIETAGTPAKEKKYEPLHFNRSGRETNRQEETRIHIKGRSATGVFIIGYYIIDPSHDRFSHEQGRTGSRFRLLRRFNFFNFGAAYKTDRPLLG